MAKKAFKDYNEFASAYDDKQWMANMHYLVYKYAQNLEKQMAMHESSSGIWPSLAISCGETIAALSDSENFHRAVIRLLSKKQKSGVDFYWCNITNKFELARTWQEVKDFNVASNSNNRKKANAIAKKFIKENSISYD